MRTPPRKVGTHGTLKRASSTKKLHPALGHLLLTSRRETRQDACLPYRNLANDHYFAFQPCCHPLLPLG